MTEGAAPVGGRAVALLATALSLLLVAGFAGVAAALVATAAPAGDDQVGLAPEPVVDQPVQGRPLTLAFAGDVMFEGMLRPQLEAHPDGLLSPVAPVLRSADLAVVNLETAVTSGGTAAPKQYAFRASEVALRALRAAGVDAVSLANNHGMDYGADGLADTLSSAADAGLEVIGAGADAEAAYAPLLHTVRGRTVAVLGATQVMDSAFVSTWPATEDRPGMASAKPEHLPRLLRAVADARAAADTVVVFLHWGVERHDCPSADQQALAGDLVAAGADVVVGGHAHRLQGGGFLDGALVAYGLGNFVFYADSGPGTDSGVLTVTVDGARVLEHDWVPARLQGGVPHLLEGAEATAARAAWEALRSCTGLDAEAAPQDA